MAPLFSRSRTRDRAAFYGCVLPFVRARAIIPGYGLQHRRQRLKSLPSRTYIYAYNALAKRVDVLFAPTGNFSSFQTVNSQNSTQTFNSPSRLTEEMHFFGDRALLGLDQERRRERTKTTILARARPRTKGKAFDDDPTRRRV